MVTLRYTGRDSALVGAVDYLSTIPIEDWKGILSQQRHHSIQSQKKGPFHQIATFDNLVYESSLEPLVMEQMEPEKGQRHLKVMMQTDVEMITDSLTRSIALSSVSPPVGKAIYMQEEPDNDLAKHFNQMHDHGSSLLTAVHSAGLSLDLTEQSNIFITNGGHVTSSHHTHERLVNLTSSQLRPSPKSGTLSCDEEVGGDDPTAHMGMSELQYHHHLYRTYSPSGSHHVTNALIPPSETTAIASAPQPYDQRRGSLGPETVPPACLMHEQEQERLGPPIRPNTEGSPRSRSSQYSRLLRSHRTAEGGQDEGYLYPPRPPSSPLKTMTIPTITPTLPTTPSSSISTSTSTATSSMGQRIQHNNKLRYRGHTAESSLSRRPLPLTVSSASASPGGPSAPSPPFSSPHLNRPKTIPNIKQLSSPRAKAMHVSYIPGVNLSQAMYGFDPSSIQQQQQQQRAVTLPGEGERRGVHGVHSLDTVFSNSSDSNSGQRYGHGSDMGDEDSSRGSQEGGGGGSEIVFSLHSLVN
jgi:hypothetical protein